MLFLLHHEVQVILVDPGISAENRAKVAAHLAALPPIDERRSALVAGATGRQFSA